MKSLIINYIYQTMWIFLAPLYFHFGSYPLFIDIIIYGQELIEIIGIYLIAFIFINFLIFYRNYLFKIFNKFTFKNLNLNYTALLNYFSKFYNNFKNYFFFKKK